MFPKPLIWELINIYLPKVQLANANLGTPLVNFDVLKATL